MSKKDLIDFTIWVINNFYTTYGDKEFKKFKKRQTYAGELISSEEYNLEDLYEIWLKSKTAVNETQINKYKNKARAFVRKICSRWV